jgi:hypothetical protein
VEIVSIGNCRNFEGCARFHSYIEATTEHRNDAVLRTLIVVSELPLKRSVGLDSSRQFTDDSCASMR